MNLTEKGKAELEKLQRFLATGNYSILRTVKASPPIGRNSPCSCNSGKKYKKCCGGKL